MQLPLLLFRCFCSLLLFSLLSNAFMCPYPDTIKPYCECKVVSMLRELNLGLFFMPQTKCSKVYQLQELKKIFSATGDRPLLNLTVEDSVINFFPASALKEKHIRVLTFTGTTMVSLFETDPEENHQFYQLNVHKTNVLRGIQWSQLQNLHNLSYLTTSDVKIRHLGKDFVENIPTSVELIRLFNTNIRTLHDEAFSKLSKVKSISLEYGRLKTLKRSMFPKENVIERLEFRSQKIVSLPDGLFNDMPKLQAVSIGDNLITTISESVFKVLADRNVVVYLYPSPIDCDDCSVLWAFSRSNWDLHATCEKPEEILGRKVTSLGDNRGCKGFEVSR